MIFQMGRSFGHWWIYTTVVSLAMGAIVSGQWSSSMLQSPVSCEAKMGWYDSQSCLKSLDCMAKFVVCECIPKDVIDVLLEDNNLPLESETICMYAIYVMEIGKPLCCSGSKRNSPINTTPTQRTWHLLSGRRFPLPSFQKKTQSHTDIMGTKRTGIAGRSETFTEILDSLRRALKQDMLSESANNAAAAVVDDDHNVGEELNTEKDIRNAIRKVNEEIRDILYKLFSQYLPTEEKEIGYTKP